MSIQFFRIKCSCGFDEVMNENRVCWNEDETCDCPDCGRELSLNRSGHGKGYSFDHSEER